MKRLLARAEDCVDRTTPSQRFLSRLQLEHVPTFADALLPPSVALLGCIPNNRPGLVFVYLGVPRTRQSLWALTPPEPIWLEMLLKPYEMLPDFPIVTIVYFSQS